MHACAAGAQSSQMKEKEGERGREGKNKQKKITKAAIFCKFGHRLQAEECQSGPHPAASAPSASERLGERRGGWRGRSGPEGEGAHGAMWSKGTPLRSARRASGTPRARSAGWAHTCRDAPGGRPRTQRQAVHTPVLAHAGCHAHACVVPSAVSPRGPGGGGGWLGAVLAVCAAHPDGHTDPTAVLGAQPQRAQTSQRGVGGVGVRPHRSHCLAGISPPPPAGPAPRHALCRPSSPMREPGGRGGTGHTQRTEPPAAPHRAQSGLPSAPHPTSPPQRTARTPRAPLSPPDSVSRSPPAPPHPLPIPAHAEGSPRPDPGPPALLGAATGLPAAAGRRGGGGAGAAWRPPQTPPTAAAPGSDAHAPPTRCQDNAARALSWRCCSCSATALRSGLLCAALHCTALLCTALHAAGLQRSPPQGWRLPSAARLFSCRFCCSAALGLHSRRAAGARKPTPGVRSPCMRSACCSTPKPRTAPGFQRGVQTSHCSLRCWWGGGN